MGVNKFARASSHKAFMESTLHRDVVTIRHNVQYPTMTTFMVKLADRNISTTDARFDNIAKRCKVLTVDLAALIAISAE